MKKELTLIQIVIAMLIVGKIGQIGNLQNVSFVTIAILVVIDFAIGFINDVYYAKLVAKVTIWQYARKVRKLAKIIKKNQ